MLWALWLVKAGTAEGLVWEAENQYFWRKAGFCVKVIIDYEDGTSDIIITDTSWQTAPCYIVESSIYDGEKQDARMIIDGWSCAGPSQKNHAGEIVEWKQAVLLNMDMSLLTARLSIPVVIKETMKPKEVIVTPAGETVLDMGQNMVGGFLLDVDLPAGSYLILQFGEILQDGNFYQGNLRTAKQTFTYISYGKPSTVRQYFTFFGYRYVKVSGWTENKESLLDKYTGTVIYSDMERTGYIETSNPKVNQLISNALWGQKGNFVDVPTDCPQRDERMGWTGDAQVFCGTASFNMDTYAFSVNIFTIWQKSSSLVTERYRLLYHVFLTAGNSHPPGPTLQRLFRGHAICLPVIPQS